MGEFQLDTSGAVLLPCPSPTSCDCKPIRFPDLNAFTQGYVEALFDTGPFLGIDRDTGSEFLLVGFSDLAPETLATIIRDCAEALASHLWGNSAGDGVLFYSERQKEAFSGFFGGRQDDLIRQFPPLTPTLGDDGLIRFAAAA